LCFWWFVLPSCCLHASIAIVNCSCVLRFIMFLSSRARQNLEHIFCGPSSKSGHNK
jgi:hypothetical protein